MIVTMEISPDSQRLIDRHQQAAGQAHAAFGRALGVAVQAGAQELAYGLLMGLYGLQAQHPGQGIAGSVDGWMVDDSLPLAALGVPANSPAAVYASIQNYGGTIYPRTARALAVPVSRQAKREESPRDMPGLVMMKRKGKPPLLVQMLQRSGAMTGRYIVHWVLMQSVYIKPTAWFDRGLRAAWPTMQTAFEQSFNGYMESVNR